MHLVSCCVLFCVVLCCCVFLLCGGCVLCVCLRARSVCVYKVMVCLCNGVVLVFVLGVVFASVIVGVCSVALVFMVFDCCFFVPHHNIVV